MNETNSTPVTQKLAIAFGDLSSLLTPANQRLLIRNHNFEKPKVLRTDAGLTIENWPYDTLEEGQDIIEEICHSLKHLYADGDRCGHRGIKRKGIQNEELQNNDFRMSIQYSYSLIRESAGSARKVVINFEIQHRKDWKCPRIVAGRITPINLTPEQLEEINDKTDVYVDSTIKQGNTVAIVRRMTAEEEQKHLNQFIAECEAEFRTYLNSAYKAAVNAGKHGEKEFPDYALVTA